MLGYTGKIAYIDLTAGTVEIKPTPLKRRKSLLGAAAWRLGCFMTHYGLKWSRWLKEPAWR